MKNVFSVGQVNERIKSLINNDPRLTTIAVCGEVSNCKYHSSGHIYFTLKDSTGSLPAMMYNNARNLGLGFTMSEGQSVVVYGRVDVYQRDGRYQLYANRIELVGTGNLHQQFERLKQLLNEEGLFDFDYKKSIPKYPKRVGIVTASTGSAIQDIMSIAKRRNPYVQLILYPAKVQGEGAADTIVAGIKKLDSMDVDTIIVGRGGGSIEDLWAFNEEKVVRAIFNAKTPIISGTGHEDDITLADYVADLRASTPSAACELAIPDVITILNQLRGMSSNLKLQMDNRIYNLRYMLENKAARLELLNPAKRLENNKQHLQELSERLGRNIHAKLDERMHRLELFTARLHGLSPTAKLVNGFGYIENDRGALTSVGDVGIGDKLMLTLHDGSIRTQVVSVDRR